MLSTYYRKGMTNKMIKLTGIPKNGEDLTVLKQTSVGETYPLHTHSFYEYFIVTKGKAIHVVNETEHMVERGTLVLVRPNDVHCYSYYQTLDFEFYNVGLKPDLISIINELYSGGITKLTELPMPLHIKLSESQTHWLEKQLDVLQFMTPSDERARLFSMLLSTVIYFILSIKPSKPKGNLPDWMISLLDQMREPQNFCIGLSRLLSIANYSQEYVNREFRRYLNTTPTGYINDLRVQYAIELLTTTEIPIINICAQCGFGNVSHFYTRFKEQCGTSPAIFRKSLRDKEV